MKSELRLKIEKAFEMAGHSIIPNKPNRMVFTDKSKSGWRIKFSRTSKDVKEIISDVRPYLRKLFPDNDVRIWFVDNPKKYSNYCGIAVKVFN